MPSNREAYFEALKKSVPKTVINFALQEINGFDYLELSKRLDEEIVDYNLYTNAINRYLNGEMIEYIFNKAYFLSMPLFVNKHVLIPRQETEQLVELTVQQIKDLFNNSILNIADICTGSGAIGIAISNYFPDNNIYMSDISEAAIEVATTNAKSIGKGNIEIYQGNMLEPLINKGILLDVLVCNPPYISSTETIEERTWKQEPHLALLANPSTFFYEQIFKDYQKVMNKKFLLAFEIGEDMEAPLEDLIKKYFVNCGYSFIKDIYGKTRFLFIKQE